MAQTVQAIFWQGEQELIDYTPGGDVAAGTLVIEGSGTYRVVGVPAVAIAANKLGALDVIGIYKIKKKAGETFSKGDIVAWDTDPGVAVDIGDADKERAIGTAIKAALSGDDYVLTKINWYPAAEQSSS